MCVCVSVVHVDRDTSLTRPLVRVDVFIKPASPQLRLEQIDVTRAVDLISRFRIVIQLQLPQPRQDQFIGVFAGVQLQAVANIKPAAESSHQRRGTDPKQLIPRLVVESMLFGQQPSGRDVIQIEPVQTQSMKKVVTEARQQIRAVNRVR